LIRTNPLYFALFETRSFCRRKNSWFQSNRSINPTNPRSIF
jgi:hypothetical protein